MNAVATTYRIFNTSIRSDIALPELPVCPHVERGFDLKQRVAIAPEWERARWCRQWLDNLQRVTLAIGETATGYVFRYPDVLDVHWCRVTQHIEYVAVPGVQIATVRRLVLDEVLPRAVAYSGGLVLHASVVVRNGLAICLVGPSGYGKSTLAAALTGVGLEPLADDAVLVRPLPAPGHLWGSYPSLRLYSDSRASVPLPQCDTAEPTSADPKTAFRPRHASVHGQGYRLAAVILLDPPKYRSRRIVIGEAAIAEAVGCLLGQSFKIDHLDRGHMHDQFSQICALATNARLFKLSYPRRYSMLNTLCCSILDSVGV